jgi:choline kinase
MTTAEKTGVVLAAGLGSRLADWLPGQGSKPLAMVHGEQLILRTFRSLERAGCTRIVVVLGHLADLIQKELRLLYSGSAELVFAINPDFKKQNGLSVLAAEPFVQGDYFILTMSDHILSDELMDIAGAFIPEPGTAALMVDYKVDSIFDMDDATKVWSENNRVVHIGKQITSYNCIDTGVFVCTRVLFDKLSAVYRKRGDASLSEGVKALADTGNMHTVDVGDAFWQDVDTPEMLEYAEKVLAEKRQKL